MMKLASRNSVNEGLLGLFSVCKSVHNLNVCVDPRLEVLAVVQKLSNYGDIFPLLSRHHFAYIQAVDKYFSPYQKHDAIYFLNDLLAQPFSNENPPFAFGAPPEVVLYLEPKGELRDDIFSNHFLVRRAGGKESLKQFVALLRSFFENSNFTYFYERHHQLYQKVVQRTSEKIGQRDYIVELEAFYGGGHGSYSVILVPLYHHVGFGPLVTIDGINHVYNVMGPHRIEHDIPDFGSETYFTDVQRHEFSHGFVNPLTEKYWTLAEPYFTAYDSSIEAQEVVNESIVRSVVAVLAFAEDKSLGEKAVQHELIRGFNLVQPLVDRMQEYVRNRKKYSSFEVFFPELLKVFEGHTHSRYTEKGTAQVVNEE